MLDSILKPRLERASMRSFIGRSCMRLLPVIVEVKGWVARTGVRKRIAVPARPTSMGSEGCVN